MGYFKDGVKRGTGSYYSFITKEEYKGNFFFIQVFGKMICLMDKASIKIMRQLLKDTFRMD